MKRIVAMGLSILMSVSLLTGCGSNDNVRQEQEEQEKVSEIGQDSLKSQETEKYESTIFDTNKVHTIDVDIAEEDWKDLLENPTKKTKYSVDVIIDGTSVENVSFATKGNTSLSQVASSNSDRYSFKINFGKYVEGQTYDGLDKLNLNNIMSDATYMKDYLSYQIMRKAGVAAPLTSYVSLSVNGEVIGLYLAVEEVDTSFLSRNYASTQAALYKPETEQLDNAGGGKGGMQMPQRGEKKDEKPSETEENTQKNPAENGEMPEGIEPPENGEIPEGMKLPENGEIPEGMEFPKGGMGGFDNGDNKGADLVYSDDEISSYSSIFDNAVTDVTQEQQTYAIEALKALSTGENIESYWDMEAVIRYFVAHNFVINYDSYTGTMLHNYYLCETNGKFSMLPWDYNLAFGGFQNSDATATVNWAIDTPLSGITAEKRPLWNVIISNDHYLDMYHTYFDELLTSYFENGEFEAEVERVREMIYSYVENDPTAFYTISEFKTAVKTIISFGTLRAESIRGQLNGTIASKTEEQKEDTLIQASDINLRDMGAQGGDKENGNGMWGKPDGQKKEELQKNTENEPQMEEQATEI